MPTPEQHSLANTPEALPGMPEPAEPVEQLEQRFRTIAVRVHEDLHSQLSFLAQLSGSSISEEIRQAIEGRLTSAQDDPALIARAEQLRGEIEREAAARTAAIAGFMGSATLNGGPAPKATPARSRRGGTASV